MGNEGGGVAKLAFLVILTVLSAILTLVIVK